MSMNIEELRKTLNINSGEMMNNQVLTNEYMVDDIMRELGYNKRRDKSVQRYLESDLDWVVSNSDMNIIAVKVYALGTDLNKIDTENLFDYCSDKKFRVVVITDGDNILIFGYSTINNKYVQICNMYISQDFSDNQFNVLKSISKEGLDITFIEDLSNNSYYTVDDVIDYIKSNIYDIAKYICNKGFNDNNLDIIKDTLYKITKPCVDNNDEIDTYKTRIDELQKELAECKELISDLNKKVEDTNTQDSLDEKIKKSEELINILDSNDESPRSYVAVIDEEIIQQHDLCKFTSMVLHKLYELKKLEAQRYIFDGDIFKLTSDCVRGDILINNKAYDIDISSLTEDEVLEKLNIIYDNFKDLGFICKKLGKLEVNYDEDVIDDLDSNIFGTDNLGIDNTAEASDIDTDENDVDSADSDSDILTALDTNTFNIDGFNVNYEDDSEESEDDYEEDSEDYEEDSEDYEEDSDNYEEDSDDYEECSEEYKELYNNLESDLFSNHESNDLSFNGSFDNFEQTKIDEHIDAESYEDDEFNSNDEDDNVLLCVQLLQLDSLIFTDEDVKFNNIKYIGSSKKSLNVNMNNNISYEQQIIKCVDGVLALIDDSDALSRLRKADLSEANNYIKLYTNEYSNCPKINGTKYVITNVDDAAQAAMILCDICNAICIDYSDIFIYLEACTKSESIKNMWNYPEESIRLRVVDEFRPGNIEEQIAIIKGNIFNNIITTRNSLKVHKDIIASTKAIKTNYFSIAYESYNSFLESIKYILEESLKYSKEINTNLIGNVIGEKYKLVSNKVNEVNENYDIIDVNGEEFYVSKIEDWLIPLSIIKAHTALLCNSSILVKVGINRAALDYYNHIYSSSEPSLSLAVSSFTKYMKSCITN